MHAHDAVGADLYLLFANFFGQIDYRQFQQIVCDRWNLYFFMRIEENQKWCKQKTAQFQQKRYET